MILTDILGYIAGICTTTAVIPQIIKVWKTKKVNDISLLTFSTITMGVLLWTVYGILKNDIPIIITNGVSLFLNVVMIYFLIYYEK